MSKTIKTENFFSYSLVIRGLFGRNRKAKLHIVNLNRESTPLEEDAIAALAAQALVAIKAKPGCIWALEMRPITIETIQTEDGTQFEISRGSFSFSEDATVLAGTV